MGLELGSNPNPITLTLTLTSGGAPCFPPSVALPGKGGVRLAWVGLEVGVGVGVRVGL